jgi:hypothetical protein
MGNPNSSLARAGRAEWGLAAFSVLACGLLLLAAEVAVRWLEPPDAQPGGLVALHEYSIALGWRPRPGARIEEPTGVTTINARGYRGREVGSAPPAGVRRVVTLGDSVTFGTYVDDSQTFAHLLDARDELEVVNLAVQGYSVGQSVLRLEREGFAYAPALVLLNVCLDNDFADAALPYFLYDGRHPKPHFRLDGDALVLETAHLVRPWRARAADALQRRSRLYNWLSARSAGLGNPAEVDEEHWSARKARVLREHPEAVHVVAHLARRAQESARRHGARLLVVLHPDKGSFRHGSPEIDALLATPVLEGVPTIDLRREYLARGRRWRDITVDGIGHLSPAGHEAAAEILADALAQEPLPSHRVAAPATATAN